jgi:hypothetical protein
LIGGKTQTDIATMDDLYLDGELVITSYSPSSVKNKLISSNIALGITDEFDLLELKGSKKKRGKKIDDPDFMVCHYVIIL